MQFSCDYCGSLISLKDKNCPQCGSVFAFVRCSNCQYNGESNEFKKGCPRCGAKKNIIAKKSGKVKNLENEAVRVYARNKRLEFWLFLIFLMILNVILFLYVGFSF